MIVESMAKNYSDLRLMQLVIGLGPGGTERLVIDMTREIHRHAYVMVSCLDELGDWSNQLTDLGIEMTCLGRNAGFDWRLGLKIARLCKQHRINVIHCHHYSPYIYGALAGLLRLGLRVVYTEHGRLSDGEPSLKRKIANQIFGRLPGRFFAVSHELREHMLQEGFSKQRLKVVHNGIAKGDAPTPAHCLSARQAMGVAPDAFVLGTVARLDAVKDLGNLLDAFTLFHKKYNTGRLVIVGDGEEMPMLRKKVADHRLEDAVVFMGKRDDVRMLLYGLDLYINCSITEGISVTILEAMASQVCVLATDVGGTGEIITSGVDGLLVKAKNSNALSQGIGQLYEDQQMRDQIAAAGSRRVATHFSMKRMVDSYLTSYDIIGV